MNLAEIFGRIDAISHSIYTEIADVDEPSLGLAPLIVKDIFHIIERLRETGVVTLLIAQNARATLHVADYG